MGYTDEKNTMELSEDCNLDTFPVQLTAQKTDLNKQTHIMISMCKVLLDCKLMASEMKPWKEPVKLNLL